ncbi:hypothetical protein ACFWJM_06305 [Streptomyces sp. NPDC127077]
MTPRATSHGDLSRRPPGELRSIGRQIESELSGVTTTVPSTAYWTA